jgi:molybdate transport system substrate-binding protein
MRCGRSIAAVAAVLVTAAFAGCGGGDDSSNTVVVSAASSLQDAFTAYAKDAGIDARQSFAGSDELAAQIRQGAKPDVYAAANTSLPDELSADGLVGQPVVFAQNTLVIAVPKGSDIDSIDDLAKPGTTIAIGDPDVPVGSYTREVLDKLPAAESRAILDNVRSEEPDVSSIVGKLTQSAVDAGFVYITDVVATDGRLTAVHLPASLQPDVQYAAAVVTGADHADEAKSFVDGLLQGEGAKALQEAGFEPPPPGA